MTEVNRESKMIRVYVELEEAIALLKKLYLDGYGQRLIEAVNQIDYRLRSGIPFHLQQEQLDRIEKTLSKLSEAIAATKPPISVLHTPPAATDWAGDQKSAELAPPIASVAHLPNSLPPSSHPTALVMPAIAEASWVRHLPTAKVGIVTDLLTGSNAYVHFAGEGKRKVAVSDLELTIAPQN